MSSAVDYSITAMIARVKRHAMLPTGMMTDTDIVEFMDDELRSTILSNIMRLREDYFLTYQDFLTDGAINQWDLPYDAIGAKLKDVMFILDGVPDNWINVARLSLSEISSNKYDYTRPYGFYLKDNKLCFFPSNIAAGQTIRLWYYKRLSHLTPVAESSSGVVYCAKVLSTNGLDIVVDAVPDGWTTSTSIDLVSHDQPFYSYPLVISNISGTTITVDKALAATDDYLCPRGETVFPQVPVELQPLLVAATVIDLMEAMRDQQGIQIANQRYQEILDDITTMLTPRIDEEVKKVVAAGGLWDHVKTSVRRPWG